MRGATPIPATGTDPNLALLRSVMPSVERHDVGLNLKLKPTIGDGDTIRLELEQKLSHVQNKDFGDLGVATAERGVRSMVTVHDQQTAVIGGLINEQVTTTQSKVPVLGDVPILGWLFRRQSKQVVKTNLLVILTPHIIRDEGDLRRIFMQKLEERQAFIRRYTAYREELGLQPVDYRHRRGLLAEINALGWRLQQERALATGAARPERGPAAVRLQAAPSVR